MWKGWYVDGEIIHVLDHVLKDCPLKTLETCFNCGEKGHIGKQCTQPRDINMICLICKQKGHRAALCPTAPKFVTHHVPRPSYYEPPDPYGYPTEYSVRGYSDPHFPAEHYSYRY